MYFFGPLENLCCEKIINLPFRSRQGSELYRDVVCQVKHSDIHINHILLSSLSLLTAEVWSVCWGLQGGHWNCSNDVIFIIHLKYKILTFVKVFCKSGGKEIISQSRSNSTHSFPLGKCQRHLDNLCDVGKISSKKNILNHFITD